ncbi:MAG: nitroreductase [Paenibacillaceae bacterium]|jgi:nitroreductase/Pyruvate/2-oxoacid:ferredoxin oxidoreductase delta subunit|nr:nitroreductase [Paenibacillaceae bacterium]
MTVSVLTVDAEACMVCGVCEEVCPANFILMNDDGPQEAEGGRCIACGHCVAACPSEALDNSLTPLTAQTPVRKELQWNAEGARQFLRSRRSVRVYREQPVSREELTELLDVARYAPTASNTQSITFQVITGKERLDRIWHAVVAWMEEQVAASGGRGFSYLKLHIAAAGRGKDTILRGAPHLVLALAPEKMTQHTARSNAEFVLAYAELYAPSLGLGTCWGGFVQHCAFSGYEPLLRELEVPEGKHLAGAIMAGYPKYRYARLVDRNPLEISWK